MSEKESSELTQLYLKFNAFVCKIDEKNESATDLLFGIWNWKEEKFVSEKFLVSLNNQSIVEDLNQIDTMHTLFKDIGEMEHLWLVVHIIRSLYSSLLFFTLLYSSLLFFTLLYSSFLFFPLLSSFLMPKIRKGKLSSSQKSTLQYKCPFGVCCVRLKESKNGELNLSIYTPSSEPLFSELPQRIPLLLLFPIFSLKEKK